MPEYPFDPSTPKCVHPECDLPASPGFPTCRWESCEDYAALPLPEGGGTATMRALGILVSDHGVERIARGLLTWEGNIEDMLDGSTEIRIDRAREIHTLAATLRL